MSLPSNTTGTTTMSLPSVAAAATAAYHRSQISIPFLTCNDNSSHRARHASLSPPPASALMKSHRHHPYKMSHSTSHPGTSSALMMMRSPPTSPPEKDHFSYYSPPVSPLYQYNSEAPYHPTNDPLQERRQRNKAASAKYRQKKNMQQHEMRTMICQLSDRNAILERQLYEIRQENQQLRTKADKLRGQLVASKLLDQWMQKHPKQHVDLNQADMETAVDLDDDDDELLMYDL